MNELTKVKLRFAAIAPPLPKMSSRLAGAVGLLTERRTDLVLATPRWGPDEAAEARAMLPAYDAGCVPGPEPLIDRWQVELLAARLRNAPVGGAIAALANMVMLTSGDLPAMVWTSETLALAVREFEWHPSAHDVDKLLRPIGAKMLAERNALRRIAASADVPASSSPTSEPEKPLAEYSQSLADRFGYRMRGFDRDSSPPMGAAAPRPPVRARPLSGDALALARAGNPTIQDARAAEAEKSHGE
jgi:hypothetical protein